MTDNVPTEIIRDRSIQVYRGVNDQAYNYVYGPWSFDSSATYQWAVDKAERLRRKLPIAPKMAPDSTVTSRFSLYKPAKIVNPIINGWRAPSPYSVSLTDEGSGFPLIRRRYTARARLETRMVIDNDRWRKQYRGYVTYRDASFGGLFFPDRVKYPVVDSMYDYIVKSMQKQVKDDSLNAALALVESRKTLALVASNITAIAKTVRRVKRLDPSLIMKASSSVSAKKKRAAHRRYIANGRGRSHRFGDDAANKWLETYYGIQPLVYDTVGLIDAHVKGITQEQQLVVARSHFAHKKEADFRTSVTVKNPTNSTAEIKYTTVTHRREYGNLWFSVLDPEVVLARQLGFNNIAAVAWDLVPLWSLLIDWVLPIGEYLQLLDYHQGLHFKGGAHSVVEERYVTGVKPDQREVSVLPGTSPRRFNFTRNIFEKPPAVRLPQFRDPLGVARALSSVALLRQRLR